MDSNRLKDTSEQRETRIEKISEHVASIMNLIGYPHDGENEGLSRTPLRVAKSLLDLTKGTEMTLKNAVDQGVFDLDHSEMVIVRAIKVQSLCEHHLLPFIGVAHVGYLPGDSQKVLGLSKLARIVNLYSRRLQTQERLTKDIANAIKEAIGASGVGVVLECEHLCMSMRGVAETNARTITSSMEGEFKRNKITRTEFLTFINHNSVGL